MTCERRPGRAVRAPRWRGRRRPPAAEIDAHTATCAACQDWLAGAQRLDRVVRATPAAAVPDLTVRCSPRCGRRASAGATGEPARAPAGAADRGRRARRRPARLRRCRCCSAPRARSAHTRPGRWPRSTSRWRSASRSPRCAPSGPGRSCPSRSCSPLCLAVTSAVDVGHAQTAVVHEIGHLAAVAQAAALWALGRGHQRNRPAGHRRPRQAAGEPGRLALVVVAALFAGWAGRLSGAGRPGQRARGAGEHQPGRQLDRADRRRREVVLDLQRGGPAGARQDPRDRAGRLAGPTPASRRSPAPSSPSRWSPAGPNGTYLVNYRVISADSHPVAGAFTYSVGAPSARADRRRRARGRGEHRSSRSRSRSSNTSGTPAWCC